MIQLIQDIWNEVIVRLWNYGTRSARLIIRLAILGVVFFVVIPLLVWPFVLLGVSFVDWRLGTWFTAGTALLPLAAFLVSVIGFVIILVVAYPLLSGVLVAIPRVRTFLGWFAVAVLIAVFGELVIGLYLAFFPVWNWPGLILLLTLLVTTLGMWLFLKGQLGWRRGGWFTTMLVLAIVGVTISFFFGGKKEAGGPVAAVQASATGAEGREIVRISLLGEDKPSEKFLGPRMVPAGWDYFFEGPPEAKVHFDDGTVGPIGPITKWYGIKGGIRRFSGPEGQEVIVRAYPPSK